MAIGAWTVGGVPIGGTIATTTPAVSGADVLTERYTILGASYNRRVATIQVGPPNFTKVKVPWRRFHRNRCSWNWAARFDPGSGCGYPSDQFEEDTRQDLAQGAATNGAEERRWGWWALNALKVNLFDVDGSVPGALYIESDSTAIEWSTIAQAAPFLFKLIDGDFEVYTEVRLHDAVEGVLAGIVVQDATGYMSTWFFCGIGQDVNQERKVVGRSVQSGVAQLGWSADGGPLVKVKRVGITFTAYESADGATWTTLGSDTLSMDALARIGLVLAKPVNSTGRVAASYPYLQFISGGASDCDRTLVACSGYGNSHRFGAFPGIPQ